MVEEIPCTMQKNLTKNEPAKQLTQAAPIKVDK